MGPIQITLLILGVSLVVAVAAFLAGTIYRKKVAEREIGSAEEEATRIINEAIRGGESKKKEMLLSCGIALWDVIQECDIKGSSDASIKNVVPAQVGFITRTAPIKRVICNGATAGRLYKKYLLYKVGIEAEVLPSTSPANAAWGFDRLSERWLAALDGVRPATDDEVDSFEA